MTIFCSTSLSFPRLRLSWSMCIESRPTILRILPRTLTARIVSMATAPSPSNLMAG